MNQEKEIAKIINEKLKSLGHSEVTLADSLKQLEEVSNYHRGYQIGYAQIVEDQRKYNEEYVHELQRTLRLCGLNEMADNFKI